MSDIALLAIGFVVFFITVYGVVVLSGIKLMKKRMHEEPELRSGISDDELEGLPTKIEY